MFKSFFVSMMAVAVMADGHEGDDTATTEDVLTWATQDPTVFKGGVGTAADKALYHLIDETLLGEGRASTSGK